HKQTFTLAFRALRNTGLALSLGLTALLGVHGTRDAMADRPERPITRHLDASGPRELVYCHQCDYEWYQDEHGLICPRCESEITEIITLKSDPRPIHDAPLRPDIPPPSLRPHDPWGDADVSDPEEADIEEHITHGPGGSVLFSQTVRASTPRSVFGNRRRADPLPQDDPDHIMRDFQDMIGNLIGPGFRPGEPGRSGADSLFAQGPFGGGFRLDGNGLGPSVIGGRFTFTTPGGRLQPRDADGPQSAGPLVDDIATYAYPPTSTSLNGRSLYVVSIRAPPDHLARIIGSLLGPMGPPGQRDDPHGMHAGLRSPFAAMLSPANARPGDAVYAQEALDQIISTLMEQHPMSNAPGPASPDAIAGLPKKKLDEKELGSEGKGNCSVCMDDVQNGDEVVVLPCTHWFHEACAGAWLSEHNTCPICRKAIEGETPPENSRRSNPNGPTSQNEYRARRLSTTRPRMGRDNTNPSRNEARLMLFKIVEDSHQQKKRKVRGDGRLSEMMYSHLDGQAKILPVRCLAPSIVSPQR
ncbi:hypothetical protein DL95DRAFT_501674, partial [Leptodontidium sp. 2 PMI_412]